MIECGCRNKQTPSWLSIKIRINKAFKLVLEIKQEEQSKLTIPMKKINLLEEFVKIFD